MQVGDALPAITKVIRQEQVNLYADAAGDHNPIHIDADFAARSQFGRRVAHGMLVLAYLSEMLTLAFGERWAASGKLKVRFRAPAFPGDTITATGQVKRIVEGDGARTIECAVECRNQAGEAVISGEASAEMAVE